MTTLVISSSAARSASRQPVQILPRQPASTVAISSAPSLASFPHQLPPVSPDYSTFPDNVLDFEELVEVDELLTELGMSPPAIGYAEAGDDEHLSLNLDHEGLLPPFQTATTSVVPPPLEEVATEPSSTSSYGSVVRSVSLDTVSIAASIAASVPDPMRDLQLDDEPPAKKQKIYTPLLPNPSTATAITTTATNINKPISTTSIVNKKIATKPKATIAKSSSIPTLPPPSYLPSTTTTTTTARSVVPAPNGRKRKLSRKEAELNMSAEELEERRERNRSHAKKSRQRKKAMTELLQESVQSLQRANQILRKGLNEKLGPQFSQEYLKSREDQQKDAFLEALKNPQNRIVDVSGLAFLKKLQKRIPKNNSTTIDDAAY